MTEFLAVALGGAFGAVLRWGMTEGINKVSPGTFPYGTLLVNIVGSLLIGIAFVYLVERVQTGTFLSSATIQSALMVGLQGAFTTFSTFSLQTLQLLAEGRWLTGAAYILGSVLLCLLATGAGIGMARLLSS